MDPLERLKVIVVDDSNFIRSVIESYLVQGGVKQIKTAGSAEELLNILKKGFDPDVVLLDLILPDKDGLEIMSYIQSGYPSTKIVILSGLGEDNVILAALRKGAKDFIHKPVKKESLLALITRIANELYGEGKGRKEEIKRFTSLDLFLEEIIKHSSGDLASLVKKSIEEYLNNLKSKGFINDFEIRGGLKFIINWKDPSSVPALIHTGKIKGLYHYLSKYLGSTLAEGLLRDAIQTYSLKSDSDSIKFIEELFIAEGLDGQKWIEKAKSLTTRLSPKAAVKIDLNRILVGVFELTDMGPELQITINPDLLPYTVVFKSGMFYFSIMGQGETYTTGVFGPFPVAEVKNWNAIVYGTMAINPNFQDPRMHGNTYLMIAIFYPVEYNHFFSERDAIKNIFERNLGQAPTQYEWRREVIEKIVKEIAELKQ